MTAEGPQVIGPNETKTFHEEFEFTEDVTFLGLGPHAHLICDYMESNALLPAGDTIPLVRIPHWDFDWQMGYQMKRPLFFPAGTVIQGLARYNNTSSNPYNPNNPPQEVRVGEATGDEMMLFFCSYLPYQPGDGLIVIDSSEHSDHHDGCITTFT